MCFLKYNLCKEEILVNYNVKSTMNIENKNIQQGICMGSTTLWDSLVKGYYIIDTRRLVNQSILFGKTCRYQLLRH